MAGSPAEIGMEIAPCFIRQVLPQVILISPGIDKRHSTRRCLKPPKSLNRLVIFLKLPLDLACNNPGDLRTFPSQPSKITKVSLRHLHIAIRLFLRRRFVLEDFVVQSIFAQENDTFIILLRSCRVLMPDAYCCWVERFVRWHFVSSKERYDVFRIEYRWRWM